jgi:4-carboxymuconolactone decarboxylase
MIIGMGTVKAQSKELMNKSLTAQQKSMVIISALTATGDLKELQTQLNVSLDSGLSINEIKEALVQLYAYCGFPRSLNAISVFMKVMEERKAKGINDAEGKPILIADNNPDKYEQGRKVLETLSKVPQQKPAPGFGEFAPRIDMFLKEHLFADIFVSDVLNFPQRELVTISALAAMTGVESQLQSHIKMGMNTGITESQLLEVAGLIGTFINSAQEDVLRSSLIKPK